MNTELHPSPELEQTYLRACFWSDCFQSPKTYCWINEKRKHVVVLAEIGNETQGRSMASFYKRMTIIEHGLPPPSRYTIASGPYPCLVKGKIKMTHKTFFAAVWVCHG